MEWKTNEPHGRDGCGVSSQHPLQHPTAQSLLPKHKSRFARPTSQWVYRIHLTSLYQGPVDDDGSVAGLSISKIVILVYGLLQVMGQTQHIQIMQVNESQRLRQIIAAGL